MSRARRPTLTASARRCCLVHRGWRPAARGAASTSSIASRWRCVLDAKAGGIQMFNIDGTDMRLDASVGVFITMNPGYKGRTELPESLKVRDQSCTLTMPTGEGPIMHPHPANR
eukprot:1190058-Prorocentrum_minimum.AAC.4